MVSLQQMVKQTKKIIREGGARGGKALSELKRKLNLPSGFFKKIDLDTEKEFLDRIYDLTEITLSPSEKLRKSDENWFQRPAFKGLIALLKEYQYKVQQNTEKVDLVDFFKLLYNCASDIRNNIDKPEIIKQMLPTKQFKLFKKFI